MGVGWGVVFVLLVLFCYGCLVAMLHAAAKKPEEQATVIVLGAAVYGDRPSRNAGGSPEYRFAKYLEANPDSVCIVSVETGETIKSMPKRR